jgi:hypothetical protein
VILQHGESYSGGCKTSRDDTASVKYIHSWIILKWALNKINYRDVNWVKLFGNGCLVKEKTG